MEFIVTSSDIKANNGAQLLFDHFRKLAADRSGYCYYKYPIAGGVNANLPDITVADLEHGLIVFDVMSNIRLDDISSVSEEDWVINGETVDSPILKLEDYAVNIRSKYDKYRPLRSAVKINYFVFFPLINRTAFIERFRVWGEEFIDHCKFEEALNKDQYEWFWSQKSVFDSPLTKDLFLSVTQGAGKLNEFKRLKEGHKAEQIGEAIRLIDTKIAFLEKTQHAAAIQIPDGPQRIRGMAGTGKTIILAMKAAFLHSKYPLKKIVYTFHTQSLYNQVRNLVTKFYREMEDKDPNWNTLLVMHSWGTKTKEGVYSRACLRNSINFVPYFKSDEDPFDYACREALKSNLSEEYDFVLMDEAQDFPASFFQLMYRLTYAPKRIIFAYDELQSLTKLSISDTGDLFGYDTQGNKLVDFSPGTYEGGIEMDFVLKTSYRNPLEVLMTAHSIGLGLYNTDGYMQVIQNKDVWKAIGYEVWEGDLKTPGENIVICRPAENSVSYAVELYNGPRKPLEHRIFVNRNEELLAIAESIEKDIKVEKVEPHDVMVVSLKSQKIIEDFFVPLQHMLQQKGIPSIIPGVGGVDRDKFGEKGFVTLSTVFKAKGNEAFVVYVMAFDYLYDYIDFLYTRNRAFTSISRSKGWCTVSGVGEKMSRAIREIGNTLHHIPCFRFSCPDPEKIARTLSQEEHARRLQEKKRGNKAIADLLSIEDDAIESTDLSEEELARIRKKFKL